MDKNPIVKEEENIHADCDERIAELEEEIENLREEIDNLEEVLGEIKALVQ